jgi:excisionase family DNA binding protein
LRRSARKKLREPVLLARKVGAVAEGSSTQQNDSMLVEWAGRISLDRIPGLLLVLASRWLVETTAKANEQDRRSGSPSNLVTAGELAKHLNLPESWVRTEERLGRIPSVRLGKYVRFRLSEVESALAQKPRRRP